MDHICRLCCSTSFVNNHIFDEENALFIKMSLYMPIKVDKNDCLPQKICDKCSCKVNDFYQFCNESIEVQNRLKRKYQQYGGNLLKSDQSHSDEDEKPNHSPIHQCHTREQSTQTSDDSLAESNDIDFDLKVEVKQEPKVHSPSPVKSEDDSCYDYIYQPSDSDDESLSSLRSKKQKEKDKNGINGVKSKRKSKKLKGLEELAKVLPEVDIKVMNSRDRARIKEVASDSDDSKQMKIPIGTKIKQLKKEPGDDVYNCCVCLTQCFGKPETLRHYRQHREEYKVNLTKPTPPPPPDVKPLRCIRCSKKLEPSQWSSHWLRHWERDNRPFRCALCEKTYRDHLAMFRHGLTHVGEPRPIVDEKRFLCDECPASFVYMRSLLAHRASTHPGAGACSLRCAVCSRAFSHLTSLRRHQRAHSGERNFLCNVCGKALSSQEHLKFHIRIHTGHKPNVCKTCGKGFVKKCNLTLHERVHSGEKPHVCTHCNKAFSQRSTLVIHERYHSGARPYVCTLCGRGFVAKGLLSMHQKTTCI